MKHNKAGDWVKSIIIYYNVRVNNNYNYKFLTCGSIIIL